MFRLKKGFTIKNVHELKIALRTMNDEEFSHYVSPHKNDFATWIKNVFKLDELAHSLHQARTRQDMISILENF